MTRKGVLTIEPIENYSDEQPQEKKMKFAQPQEKKMKFAREPFAFDDDDLEGTI